MEYKLIQWFDFYPEATKKIAEVVEHYPISLNQCAEALELIAPYIGTYTFEGFKCRLKNLDPH